jgi:TatD DNase family protein
MAISFIDSHAHLNLMPEGYPPDAVFERARGAGLEALVNVGTDLSHSRESVSLAEKNPRIFATVGLHPSEAHLWNDEVSRALEDMARSPRVVAIGETGLDFSYPEPSRDDQERAFKGQIALARRLGLPLVIHCRDAFDRLFAIVSEERLPSPPGVLHCFTGGLDSARTAVGLGFYLSFSGIVTFRNAEVLRSVVRAVPEDRILVETDCPYLAPVPYRGKTNEPAFIPEILNVLSLEAGRSSEALSQRIVENTRTLFRLPERHGQ